ncbi:CopG family ribbon-helix-helix protein [Acidilobus saccharovorans]|uniref:CopG family ribbon-helix-helix protein n=1 Tax=Acidilobus saccharovorans TaxID=242703 RepID=UPI000AA6DBE8|nr:CopG family ribbon-helix-helix protein [Acidilobus saccharovorans]
MGNKVRFGVSLPDDLSRELDLLAAKVNVSRSELVEQALRNMLSDYIHYLVPHDCDGVMVALCPESRGSEDIIEQYSDIAETYIHAHRNGKCFEVLMLSGPSQRISELHGKLLAAGCGVRFLPSLSLESYFSMPESAAQPTRKGEERVTL